MKKLFLILGIIVSSIVFLSCEENLNPYGELKDRYILTCIVRGDTTFQSATLTKAYQVLDVNGYSNTTDPNIRGAIIRLWNGNDKVTFLKDTTIARPKDDPYKTPYSAYYTNSFTPDPNATLMIEAILPNGKRLNASTKVPKAVTMNYGNSDLIIPVENSGKVHYSWVSDMQNPVFIVRLTIQYYKNENGTRTRKIYEVPQEYVSNNGVEIPVYPKPIFGVGYTLDMSTITRAMQLISEGDDDKASYEILGCVLEVISLDQPLSSYYNSTVRGSDTFSLNLNETDYTNVYGGYGVFGVYLKTRYVSFFKWVYLQNFGYTPGSERGR